MAKNATVRPYIKTARRGPLMFSRMLKKAIWLPQHGGRGSVSACKHVAALPSRARERKEVRFGTRRAF